MEGEGGGGGVVSETGSHAADLADGKKGQRDGFSVPLTSLRVLGRYSLEHGRC